MTEDGPVSNFGRKIKALLDELDHADWPHFQLRIAEFFQSDKEAMGIVWENDAALPETSPQLFALLSFLRGYSLLNLTPSEAREHLRLAYSTFSREQHKIGQLFSWFMIIDSFALEWNTFDELDFWIEEANYFQKYCASAIGVGNQNKFAACLLIALMYRQPDNSQIHHWAHIVKQAFYNCESILEKLLLGHHLIFYYSWWQSNLGQIAALLQQMRPQIESASPPPMIRILWLVMEANYSWMTGDGHSCLTATSEGLKIGRETNAHSWDFMLHAQQVFGFLTTNDLDSAEKCLQNMANTLSQNNQMHLSLYNDTCGIVALRRSKNLVAEAHAQLGVLHATKAGMPFAQCMCHITLARAYHHVGKVTLAKEALGRAVKIAEAMQCNFALFMSLDIQWNIEHDTASLSSSQSIDLIQMAEQYDFFNSQWLKPETLSELCHQAIIQGASKNFVFQLVQKRKLSPPVQFKHSEHWPWSIKISTLGRFEVYIDQGTELVDTKKNRKPLQIIEAIIAYRSDVCPRKHVVDLLWPEKSDKAADHALDTAIYRLRKVLKSDDAVVVNKGNISINRSLVWVDCYALDDIGKLVDNVTNTKRQLDIPILTQYYFDLRQLYRGHNALE
ncbi:MAG: winged helix-turn-helix domain-containing protein, partial [Gammaproteobacteria bacterium]|nr:winged helix-turn-helix domain-containing protein [Gammaproteobacteria bacterium]